MKKAFALLCLFIVLAKAVQSQPYECFGAFDFDSAYVVIGVSEVQGDKAEEMSRYNFVIDSHDDLVQLKKDWVFTKQPYHKGFKNSVFIHVAKDKKYITTPGIVSCTPSISGLSVRGDYYPISPETIEKLHQSHPLNYVSEKRAFGTVEQYQEYHDSVMKQPSLLFIIEPNIKLRGIFTVKIKKTDKLPHPKAIIEELTREFTRFVDKDEFQMYYGGSIEDALDTIYVKIKVWSSRKLYDAYRDDKFEISGWQPNDIFATTYWRL